MWKSVAKVEDVKKQGKMRIESGKEAILLSVVNDQIYAIADKCPHLGHSLFKGSLENEVLTCAAHHAQIDVTNGKVVGKAKIAFIKMNVKDTKTYPVKIDQAHVLVDI